MDMLTLDNIGDQMLSLTLKDFNFYLGNAITQEDLNYVKRHLPKVLDHYREFNSYDQESIREEFIRHCMEYLFSTPESKKEFKRVRPDWLIGISGYPIELDGYNEDLKVAFEHNGPHHDSWEFWVRRWGMSNEEAKIRHNRFVANDEIKNRECFNREIHLITIVQEIQYKDIYNEIINQYEALSGEKAPDKPPLDWERLLADIIRRRLEGS